VIVGLIMTLRAVIVPRIARSGLEEKESGMPDTPAAVAEATEAAEDLVEDETLIEEVSIDGMCGVY
jgi:mycofactocin precursor